jgi:predicted nuclease of predicted toxin-antitoxin system
VARFYSNENIALPAVMELRRLGHDVLTSRDAGNANAAVPDPEVLAFAASEDRILLSHNRRHFLDLHRRRSTPHAGMVLCTFDADFVALARRIHEAVADAGDIRDGVIRVNRLS